MTSKHSYAVKYFYAVVVGAIVLGAGGLVSTNRQRADAQEEAGVQPEPVEGDMHEFMEYAFQPVYQRLKQSLAKAPATNDGWKAIKSDSLLLAEGGNLLLLRTPEEDVPAWRQLSVAVRDLGGKVYQSAKKKDFPGTRQNYEAMIVQCNACHDKFANGEHQLEP